MKSYLTLLLLLCAASTRAQTDTVHKKPTHRHAVYVRHSLIPTLSLGFVDAYRNKYSLPADFRKGNTSGFVPVYAKLEYGLGENIGLAATLCYDAFNYNFSQQYEGNNGTFLRYRTSAFRMYSGGLTAFYHLGNIIHVKRLDPFVGLGFTINNIRYSAYPQGDSTLVKTDHNTTIYLKAGARYYISDKFSLYGDVGYDKHTIFSLGFSCRFLPRGAKELVSDVVETDTRSAAVNAPTEPPIPAVIPAKPAPVVPAPQPAAIEEEKVPTVAPAAPVVVKEEPPVVKEPETKVITERPLTRVAPKEKKKAEKKKDKNVAKLPGKQVEAKEDKVAEEKKDAYDHKLPDEEVGKVYPVDGFYFGFNKSSVYSGDTHRLDVLYKLLKKQHHLKVQIQAYTDCRGDARVNKRVAMRRAASYKKYLEKKGIAGSRITCKWFGTRDPEVKCDPCNSCSEAQHRQNRRMEFKIIAM